MTRALDRSELERYSRAVLLPGIGISGQARLAGSRVLVVGAGGLGSPALLYLAAAGVGTIGVVDDDDVHLRDLSRQVVHTDRAVGRPKSDSAAESLARLNPGVTVVGHAVRLTPGNAGSLLSGYEVVVDGSDNFATRYALSDACVALGIPHVWGCALRFDGQASVWWAGHGPCYRCVFPQALSPQAEPSGEQAGVLGPVCAAIGSVQATETVKLLLGIGEPLLGRLLLHDGLRQTWDTMPVRADPRCPSCGVPRATEPAGALAGPHQERGLPPHDRSPV